MGGFVGVCGLLDREKTRMCGEVSVLSVRYRSVRTGGIQDYCSTVRIFCFT